MFSTTSLVLMLLSYREARRVVGIIDSNCLYTREKLITPFDAEHVVPRSFTKNKYLEKDMHVLFKCTPSVNRSRGNKRLDTVSSTATFAVDNDVAKGVVSRACLYFVHTHLTRDLRRSFYERVIASDLLEEWYELHGKNVTEHDLRRNWIIHRAQGNSNPYVCAGNGCGSRSFFFFSHPTFSALDL